MNHALRSFALLLLLSGCGFTTGPHPGDSTPLPPPPPAAVVVRYEVDGQAEDATVTMQTPSGISQEAVAHVPLDADETSSWDYDGFTSGAPLYVSVQGGTENTAITCRIKIDDQVVSENSSSAAYGIATCQSYLP